MEFSRITPEDIDNVQEGSVRKFAYCQESRVCHFEHLIQLL